MKKFYTLCLLWIFILPVNASGASINVVTPNGGETWLIGCPQPIQWITAAPMPVKIELFRNGTFFKTIASQVPSSQNSYSWTPPYSIIPGNTYKVKISSLTNTTGFDFSDGNFSINLGTLTVTSPNGGEVWLYGTTHMILWNDNLCENVRIELWKGGSYSCLLAASTPSTESFPWAIVSSIPAGSDYKIKIMSTTMVAGTTNVVFDFSDNNFTIGTPNPCLVTVTSPNGGEIWAKGTTHLITWQQNVTYPVRIELWEGGIYKSLIAASAPGTGTYPWAIPMTITSGNDYKIKILVVSSAASYTCYDFSDNNFIIPGSGATSLKYAQNDFKVYPNPCNDLLNVKLPGDPGPNTYSQNYPPFLQNIGWCVEEYIGTGSIVSSFTNTGDTTIDNLSYSKLFKGNELFLVREDIGLRKVWVILPNSSSETLLYDFAVSPGSSIALNYFGNIPVLYHVDSFDSISTSLGLRKRIKLSTADTAFNPTLYWIEGTGSNYGPVYLYDPTYAPGFMSEGHCLICAYIGTGVQSYSGSCGIPCIAYPGSPCYSFMVGMSDLKKENTRIIIENVGAGLIRIQLNTGNIQELRLFSIEGKLLKIVPDVNKNELFISTNDWITGLYILQVTSGNGSKITGKIFK